MACENMTLADIRRLVAAIEQAGGPQAVRAIINRMPADDGEHGRVTFGTLVKLLNQLNGKTVLSDEDLTVINRSEESVIVQPTFAELVAACHFSKVDSQFNEENLPLQEDASTNPIIAYHLNKNMGMQSAIRELTAVHNFHLVGMRRALEWRAVNANHDYPVVIIGAVKEDPRKSSITLIPSFRGVQSGTRADVSRFEAADNFDRRCRFLVCER